MNLTCFYCQTPFTLSTEVKIAALRKMHAENLHHYDARCPKCGRANAVSRERLEMFTPGWEEAIKAPAMEQAVGAKPAMPPMSAPSMPPAPAPMMAKEQSMSAPAPVVKAAPASAGPTRRRHAPAARKAARKAVAKRKPAAKKAAPKKRTTARARKKTAVKAKKSATRSKARKPARKTKKR